MSPFDYVNSVSFNKKNMMRGTDNDEFAEKEYVPYLVNKSLSYFTDTILYSNEMNKHSFLDNKMQYEYLLHSIRPIKRFSKWAKKSESKQVMALSKYFKVNYRQAEEYMTLLDSKTVTKITAEIEKI